MGNTGFEMRESVDGDKEGGYDVCTNNTMVLQWPCKCVVIHPAIRGPRCSIDSRNKQAQNSVQC
jgi:hypothetical protein